VPQPALFIPGTCTCLKNCLTPGLKLLLDEFRKFMQTAQAPARNGHAEAHAGNGMAASMKPAFVLDQPDSVGDL
jgi:hypothetical protein